MTEMTNTAPWPDELEQLVSAAGFKPGWSFQLHDIDRGQGSKGLTLTITVWGPNSYSPADTIGVRHLFIVPAASYDRENWQWWLMQRVIDVERHEAMEWFTIDGAHVYPPDHGDGRDPYVLHPRDPAQVDRRPGS